MASIMRKYGGHKAQVTQIIKKIEVEISKSDLDQTVLLTLKTQLISQQQILTNLFNDILEQIDEKDAEKVVLDFDSVDFDITFYVRKLSEATQPSTDDNVKENFRHKEINLPQTQLPKFNGEVEQWNAFWDQFENLIHLRTDLSSVTKFNYLRSSLTGSAYKLINNFSTTSVNYNHAVQLLKETYADTERNIREISRSLLHMKHPAHNVEELMDFRGELESTIRSLEALQCNIEDKCWLISTIVTEKLNPKTVEMIQRLAGKNYPRLDEIRKFLLEVIHNLTSSETKRKPKWEKGGKPQKSWSEAPFKQTYTTSVGTACAVDHGDTPTDASTGNKKSTKQSGIKGNKCTFCEDNHYSGTCPKYCTFNLRKDRLKELKRCTRCCIKLDLHKECQLIECPKCSEGKHHSFLCPKNLVK